jgi:P2-related tail formation protein
MTPIEPWKLLPLNATKLERDLLRTLPISQEAQEVIARLDLLKYEDTPEEFLPWLIVENGLLWAKDFLGSDQEILEKGVIVNRLKGTPAAVKQILSWFGYDSTTVREADRPLLHFAEFEVDPGNIVEQLARIGQIYEALQHVIPVRSRFKRIFHGYDKKIFYMGESKLGEDFLNTPSGIDYDALGYHSRKTGLIVSFGRIHTDGVPARVFEVKDYRYTENFRRHSGQLDKGFPTLCEDFEGKFYDPRMSVIEMWSRVSTAMCLQPVANWSDMTWNDLIWNQKEILDSHETT